MPTSLSSDTTIFMEALLAHSGAFCHIACLTLSAIHPGGHRRTPSRHIPLDRPDLLRRATTSLLDLNRQGWGAYVAVGLRSLGLSRYQRGGLADVLALPALFVDVDNPASDMLACLRNLQPAPSCIVFSGGGYHAYWWLRQPLTDMAQSRQLLAALQAACGGDPLSPAQSMRLPGSVNTKAERHHARCQIVSLSDTAYTPADFAQLTEQHFTVEQRRTTSAWQTGEYDGCLSDTDAISTQQIAEKLLVAGYRQRGEWLNGSCIRPERHRHGDRSPSFGYNLRTGWGHCFRCGSVSAMEISTAIW